MFVRFYLAQTTVIIIEKTAVKSHTFTNIKIYSIAVIN